ncbi:nucleolar protein 12 [Aspergillus terreus NIH2624]|uniref:Nucleolar protein 12 n=1 Tax=Aspergillus terreus (strain NIH 2624 / FGSC A1156) TaxID=341663 RepID=Q0D1Y1_ASPTN|nr:nucleolar protein 12 [Aspergillus terreus NIH2624]EAU38699.1 nucleolar protein 12 [Aspergillus terreus NIH2624]
MGKKSKSQSQSQSENPPQTGSSLPFLSGKTSVDPTLASLFENSSGPVKAPSIPAVIPAPSKTKPSAEEEEDVEDEELSEIEEELPDEDESMQDAAESPVEAPEKPVEQTEGASRKRKRTTTTDDLEDSYMRRIAKEEQKEEKKRREEKAKRQKVDGEQNAEPTSEQSEEEDDESSEEEVTVPKHETETGDTAANELERSNRTVFLGNVSSEAIKSKSAKKTLLRHLASVLSTLPESTGPHKVESIRFRSTAFASGGKIPKRAAFAKRELLDETTPSTNAYAVYSTIQGARKALSLNGTVVLDRHLRVDSVAHPAKIDNKRCVFVGNLDFVDQEGEMEGEEKKKKKRAPADVEEGLWRTFNAHTGGSKKGDDAKKGSVESVRVVRDRATRVGKGFAYVQFYDENCVEEALLLNGKNFPPMLPRKIRVSRAKKVMKKREDSGAPNKTLREADKTLQGRAGKLFGRAGAAKLKADAKKTISQNSLVFEGHRATEDGSRIRVKTKSRGSKGKPKNRSSKRAAAFRAAGGKKADGGK